MDPALLDCNEALMKFGHEVLNLLDLYRHAQHTMSNQALADFNVQFVLVEALARVAILPITTVVPNGGVK